MGRQSTSGKLTAVQVKQAKPKQNVYRLSDGAGMYLEVRPTGSRYWRMRYRFNGKEKLYSIGVFPNVSLADARLVVIEVRSNLANDIDPIKKKHQDKLNNSINTFENLATEWHKKEAVNWCASHADKVLKSLKTEVFKAIGDVPIQNIKTPEILMLLHKVESRGAYDVASRIKQRIGAIFRYAICIGRVEHNPADALKGVLKTRKVKHRAALPAKLLPDFLEKLECYDGYELTKLALKLLILTFVRPGELRGAEWSEFNFEKSEWRIPAERMKMSKEHIVPLSHQAIEVIQQISKLTRKYKLMFPGTRNVKRPMSENTLTYAIRKRLGFDATAHGFRATASTVLNESNFKCEVIERQLAHTERNKVRAAYNRSLYLNDRKEMMQWWADFLDKQNRRLQHNPNR